MLLTSDFEVFLNEILKSKNYILVFTRIELREYKNLGETEQEALDSFIENAEIFIACFEKRIKS